MANAVAALGSNEFVEPPPTATNLILYDQFFDELNIYTYKTNVMYSHICYQKIELLLSDLTGHVLFNYVSVPQLSLHLPTVHH